MYKTLGKILSHYSTKHFMSSWWRGLLKIKSIFFPPPPPLLTGYVLCSSHYSTSWSLVQRTPCYSSHHLWVNQRHVHIGGEDFMLESCTVLWRIVFAENITAAHVCVCLCIFCRRTVMTRLEVSGGRLQSTWAARWIMSRSLPMTVW